jgi:hypothetical protein
METLAMIILAFGKENMSHTWVFEWQGRTKKVTWVQSKVKTMFIIFFDIKGIVHKEFVLAGQTVNYAFSCDILQRLCYLSTLPFTQGNFLPKKKYNFHSPPTILFSVSPIENKIEKLSFCHNRGDRGRIEGRC